MEKKEAYSDFAVNPDTGGQVFYHGSKKGIFGKISPSFSVYKTDFGDAFYMGTQKIQTLDRVSNESSPYAYGFKIPSQCLNPENTLELKADDWVYFVLYNRGMLEDLAGTEFYNHYAHLGDGKDFIVGPIADDVYDKCMQDFFENNITDYTFKELIDSFDYGTQVAAKSQRACDSLICIEKRKLTKEDRKEIQSRRKMTKKERFALYSEMKARLNESRKGKFFSEIKREIFERERAAKRKNVVKKRAKRTKDVSKDFQNVSFPKTIHSRKDVVHGLFK